MYVIRCRTGRFVLDEDDVSPLARAKVFATRAEAEGEAQHFEVVMTYEEAQALMIAQAL